MNTGIIATRYATALLKLVDETGSGSAVVDQVRIIEKALDELPDFRRAVSDPTVAPARKLALFEAALSSLAAEPVEAPSLVPDLRKFLELLIRNGRIGDVRLIFTTFINEYYRSRHIKRARLVVADSALLNLGSTLESRLRELIGKETGCELLLETKVDPSLIGGFVFEVEDTVLDASVSRQLDVIRHQFIEKNRRIV